MFQKKEKEFLDRVTPKVPSGRYSFTEERYYDPVAEAEEKRLKDIFAKAARKDAAKIIATAKTTTTTVSTKSLGLVAKTYDPKTKTINSAVTGVKSVGTVISKVATTTTNKISLSSLVASTTPQVKTSKIETISGYFEKELGDGSNANLQALFELFQLNDIYGKYDGKVDEQSALKNAYEEYKNNILINKKGFNIKEWGSVLPNMTDAFLLKMKDIAQEKSLSNTLNIYYFAQFIWNVIPGHEWDLKNQSKSKGGYQGLSHLKIGDTYVRNDFTGNVAFGYAGKALKIPKCILLAGAGGAQFLYDIIQGFNKEKLEEFIKKIITLDFNINLKDLFELLGLDNVQFNHWKTFFDDPADQEQIKVGIALWDTYEKNIDKDKITKIMAQFNKDYLSQWNS
jgi:hypothetical protein